MPRAEAIRLANRDRLRPDPDDDARVRGGHDPARRLERDGLRHEPRDRHGHRGRPDAGAGADPHRDAGRLQPLRRLGHEPAVGAAWRASCPGGATDERRRRPEPGSGRRPPGLRPRDDEGRAASPHRPPSPTGEGPRRRRGRCSRGGRRAAAPSGASRSHPRGRPRPPGRPRGGGGRSPPTRRRQLFLPMRSRPRLPRKSSYVLPSRYGRCAISSGWMWPSTTSAAEARAEAEEQHPPAPVAAERLHDRVVDEPDRLAERPLVVEADPAPAEVRGLLRGVAVGHRPREADRDRVVRPVGDGLPDRRRHARGGEGRARGHLPWRPWPLTRSLTLLPPTSTTRIFTRVPRTAANVA